MFVCVYSVFVLSCVSSGLQRADHSSKESYQLSISVTLRNLVRGGLSPTWAGAPLNNNNNNNVTLIIYGGMYKLRRFLLYNFLNPLILTLSQY
jgi:hypothetical protein